VICADWSADEDLTFAAERIATFANYQAGQSCVSVQRVYVHEWLYDGFLPRLVAAVSALRTGDPTDEETDVGPLINEAAAEAVEAAITATASAGARVGVGGGRDGAFIDPTVLTEVPAGAEAIEREVFGPVAPLMRMRAPEEATEIANRSRQGLQAAVFTRDIERAFALAIRLEVGGVVINGSSALRAENMPFGGVKETGGGREGLHDTLLAMTSEKSIIVMNARR